MKFERISKTDVYLLTLAVSIFVLAACATKRFTVSMSPQAMTLVVGDSTELKAKLTDSNGRPIVGEKMRFTTPTGNAFVASVTPSETDTDANGDATVHVFGKADGKTSVTARWRRTSLSDTSDVMVIPIVKEPNLSFSPHAVTLRVGDIGVVRATVKRGGVPQAGVTVTFTTGNGFVARVTPTSAVTNPAGQAAARVFGRADGKTSVTARSDDESASTAITVIPVIKDLQDNRP